MLGTWLKCMGLGAGGFRIALLGGGLSDET